MTSRFNHPGGNFTVHPQDAAQRFTQGDQSSQQDDVFDDLDTTQQQQNLGSQGGQASSGGFQSGGFQAAGDTSGVREDAQKRGSRYAYTHDELADPDE